MTDDRDRTMFAFAAEPRTGIPVGTKYVWDYKAEGIRRGDEALSTTNPCYQLLSYEFLAYCRICGESNH